MKLAKGLFEKENTSWEDFISPRTSENPLLHVREFIGREQFEARFILELGGVRRNGRKEENLELQRDARAKNFYRATLSLLNSLSLGHKLEFVYSGGNIESLGNFFNWKIVGHALGSDAHVAAHEARRLSESLNLILRSVANRDYEFAPVLEAEYFEGLERDKGYVREAIIEPEPMRICSAKKRDIGFIRVEKGPSALYATLTPLCVNKSLGLISSTVYGAQECPAPVTLRIAIERFLLSQDQISIAREVVRQMQSGKTSIEMASHDSDDRFDDSRLFNLADRSLRLWLTNPFGVRVCCEVSSSEPIPHSFLRMAGSEVFAGYRITITEHKREMFGGRAAEKKPQGHATERLLDLAGCINESSALPVIFPITEALKDSGVRRVYALKAPQGPSEGIILGISDGNKSNGYVYYASTDRDRHTYVIGASGTGKSTLLYHMIIQDIREGGGVIVLDPHKDLYEAVLGSIPTHRQEDVILVDPCDFEHVVGINFLECSEAGFRDVEMNFAANEMVMIFDRLYDLRQTGGPMFEQYVRNAMLLVMDNSISGGTLVDVVRIFEDDGYRRLLKEHCKNQLVKNFWEKQAEKAYGDCKLENMAPYITSKLNQFVTNAVLRPIIGASRSTIDFRSAMDDGKILLVNLSKGILGALDSHLLGMLITGKIFSAALSRVTMTQDSRKRMNVYIDEFQNFTTDSVAHLISEARKFGICLTLANQNLSQLSASAGKQSILDAVIGNVGTILMFRIGAMDSAKLQAYTKPELTAEDLQELPDFHVAARMLCNNVPHRPFVFKTLPMPNISGSIDTNGIVESSRRKYGLSREAVEQAISRKLMASSEKNTDAK